MDDLQIIYPYYENPHMLDMQLFVWANWPPELRDRVEIIVVDDGSPRNPAQAILQGLTGHMICLYRIKENIPWNQNGAHNLGMQEASEGWCVSTDIDHVITNDQLEILLNLDVDEGTYYTFARRQVGHEDIVFKRHPNSWLLTRDTFWKSGGYDEDFSGYYGSDSVFRRGLDLVAKRVELDSPFLTVYDENDIPDANTREFGRKDSKYHSVKHPHLLKKRRNYTRPTNPLRFDWERVL